MKGKVKLCGISGRWENDIWTPMYLSETLFLESNGAISCPWKHYAMIVQLYMKGCTYFLCYIWIESII